MKVSFPFWCIFKKTRFSDIITSLIKFYLRQSSFVNKLKIYKVKSLLGLGPFAKEITGKFMEPVKEKTVKINSRSLQLY